jgi:hypothetical protein
MSLQRSRGVLVSVSDSPNYALLITFHPKTCLVCQLVVLFNLLDITLLPPLDRKRLPVIVELPTGKRFVPWVSEISLTVSLYLQPTRLSLLRLFR